MAGRSIRSRRASCPCSSARGHAVVEFHLADRKAYRATVCFGASSTTDDLEGRADAGRRPAAGSRGGRGGTRRLHGHDLAAAAGVLRDQGRRPSCLRDGPGRRDRRAEDARGDDRGARRSCPWDDTDPDRPIAVVDVVCSAGTYVRALARDLGSGVGSAAYLGALRRTRRGRSPRATPWRSTPSGPRPRGRRACGAPPTDRRRASSASRRSTLTASRGRGRGPRPVRQAGGRDPDHRATTTASARRTARSSRSALPRAADASRRTRSCPRRSGGPVGALMDVVPGVEALRPSTARSSRSSACSTGSIAATPTCSITSCARRPRRGCAPAVITFDHHPDEVLTGSAPPLLLHPDERLERLADAGVDVIVVQHFDDAVRRTTYDDFVEAIRAGTPLAGLLMTPDAAFGFERRARPTPRRTRRAGRFRLVVVAVHDGGGRGAEHRHPRVHRARRLGARAPPRASGHGHRLDGPGEVDAGRSDFSRPMALPPDGDHAVRVDGTEALRWRR